mmetsp:Transcript_41460/g.119959  ORF Transcript_41460/g.119959 Transcript_41460/m.119959 type:complete len:248 (-) Transcript_41460:1493-2236(-)
MCWRGLQHRGNRGGRASHDGGRHADGHLLREEGQAAGLQGRHRERRGRAGGWHGALAPGPRGLLWRKGAAAQGAADGDRRGPGELRARLHQHLRAAGDHGWGLRDGTGAELVPPCPQAIAQVLAVLGGAAVHAREKHGDPRHRGGRQGGGGVRLRDRHPRPALGHGRHHAGAAGAGPVLRGRVRGDHGREHADLEQEAFARVGDVGEGEGAPEPGGLGRQGHPPRRADEEGPGGRHEQAGHGRRREH